jgi:ABC-type antimicrobial peptide transport system permease subunit
VTRLFVWDALILSGVGAAVGLTAALGLTRLMKSVLFDVSPADPLTFITVSVLLVFAAALASYLPARHAARVNPVEALRAE